jgi:hypothetical protein
VRSVTDASYRNCHLIKIYKNHLNYKILSQVQPFFRKIVIISINQERLIMMCQIEPDLRQIKQIGILAVELGLRCKT